MLKGLVTAGLVLAFGAVGSPAHATTQHRPANAAEVTELQHAQHNAGSSYTCHLEWDGPAYQGYEAICTRKPVVKTVAVSTVIKAVKACTVAAVGRKDVATCVSLYLRPASWNGSHTVYTPAGSALVPECLDQYRGTELHSCLTQPAE